MAHISTTVTYISLFPPPSFIKYYRYEATYRTPARYCCYPTYAIAGFGGDFGTLEQYCKYPDGRMAQFPYLVYVFLALHLVRYAYEGGFKKAVGITVYMK